MVGIAQLVEHLVVVQGAAGSSPVTHPKENPQSYDWGFTFLWSITKSARELVFRVFCSGFESCEVSEVVFCLKPRRRGLTRQ